MSLYRDLWEKETSHTVRSVTPNDKNIELRVILLERVNTIELKTGELIYQFLVADASGSIKCNFFGNFGKDLRSSDIVFLSGVYATLYKESTLTLYTGKRSKVYKIGEFFYQFVEEPKMSESLWEKDAQGNYNRVSTLNNS